MIELLRDYYHNIVRKKAFWIPLLFYSFGGYGFSMLNRTVSADDLATSRYVNGTIWLSELRWGGVLWKRLLSFGDAVPFLDKYLSFFFLICAATVFSCIWYVLRERRGSVWSYAAVACVFTTFPILQEIWEYTCGGTLIVPGDFLLTFLVILYLLTQEKLTKSGIVVTSLVMTLVCSSAESLAPCYVAAVMMILYYKYCVRRVQDEKAAETASASVHCAPGGKAAWVVDGLRYALILVIAMILRLVIGFSVMKVLGLSFEHTGDTYICWPLSGEELRLLIGQFITDYGAAGLLYLPIALFLLFLLVFFVYSLWQSARTKSPLPVLLGFLVFVSLFSLTLIQGMVMWYRTAITLLIFASFVTLLLAEVFESWRTAPAGGLRRILGSAGFALLFFLCWRQAAYTHKLLALDNLRSENEAAAVRQLGHDIVSGYDAKPVVFVGEYSLGSEIWVRTAADGYSFKDQIYYEIRYFLTGKTNKTVYVQSNVTSAMNWYKEQFDGELMDDYFAYYGYDLDVVENISEEDYLEYLKLAMSLEMKPLQIEDMGSYLLVCVGRLELPEEDPEEQESEQEPAAAEQESSASEQELSAAGQEPSATEQEPSKQEQRKP